MLGFHTLQLTLGVVAGLARSTQTLQRFQRVLANPWLLVQIALLLQLLTLPPHTFQPILGVVLVLAPSTPIRQQLPMALEVAFLLVQTDRQ
jgi:hypothetical protein